MADVNIYFSAMFGNVPMLIGSIQTQRGRDVAIQSPSIGDRHSLSDRGLKLRSTSCEILFVDQPGQAPYTDRYDQFLALVESGDPQIFSHPLDGSYNARASEMSVDADSSSLSIKVSCTFLRDDEPQQVFPIAAGSTTAGGVESVSVAAANVNELLAGLEPSQTDPTPQACVDAVTAWQDAGEDLDPQSVFLTTASLTQKIDDLNSRLSLTRDLAGWPAYRGLTILRAQIVYAARAATAAGDTVFDLYIEQDRPLRAICAEVYGASEADDFAARIARSNRIRTPGLVPGGTTLKMIRRAA